MPVLACSAPDVGAAHSKQTRGGHGRRHAEDRHGGAEARRQAGGTHRRQDADTRSRKRCRRAGSAK
eukprot:3576046-Rhodomonas_salina.1